MELEDKRALVTGGASGIGRGIARELAEAGADVAIADQQREPKDHDADRPTDQLVRDTGSDALFRAVDVSDHAEVEALVASVVDEFGGLDVLVNNAGVIQSGAVEELSPEEWHRPIEVNLTGAYNCSRHAIPHLRKGNGPRIVNVASQLGLVGRAATAAYCASKGGLVNLTRAMALDYADERITVNAICPGVIETSMTRASLEDPEHRESLEQRTPMPFFGRPEDVGKAAVYLCSPAGRYVTGHCLVVDGGYTAR